MKRDILNSPRLLELKREKRRIFLNKILLLGFGLLMVLVGLVYISRIDKLNISEIEIVGNNITDTQIIKESVKKEIIENYFLGIPKTNIFFYPQNSIKNKLQDKFKRLKDISFSIKNNKILEVSLTERVAKYTWCRTNLPQTQTDNDNQKCYFLDESGYIFDEAPYFSGEVYFKFYGLIHTVTTEENLPTQTTLGSYFSQVNFEKLISLKETLETMKLKPVALYVIDNENIKIYLSNKSLLPTGPEIIFKIDSNFQKVAENLQTALTTEPLKSDFKNKYSSLLYIDLRFGNKVYYKFQ
ncbi:hypothetical protein A3B85_02670 [Candidatus Nomurabacteria bacterium RIFCSPHIGHO2_02_FULL_37_13]|uniref:POTRA domain-containing protein n=1 Tax=Candidatus Nomurabacteria bacterium RIFCSPHIGHO2_02_FULL_37_13 TaxID=1801750 RepID=A0A1F6W7I7_9BACT|nr:MAG: hypothetical protein A2640_01720 [Candidatus Nomurabacteria bacterium RIFCSPHIGHO2_01_FULL_36_23]OGI77635.1 MAG: hypothetical protein A3B85_02670 [Candidatus Nomurabacteria bacterium RIFCSPHIGHO2_02_FULL_37_13]OGI88275.1 MAG: hypothetical protein A2906_01845 [Candidatus Nomurabacteria bacterium RIFCSPLOWO2_01_FULL_37_25]